MKWYHWAFVAIILSGGGIMIYTQTRGLRNNNPGNIRHGDNWQGMKANQTDDDFVQFVNAKYGIRAMARILDNYAKRGVVYLSDIILTWAPPNENDTHSYIAHVEQQTGIFANERITRDDYPKLIAAMIKHENGINPYSDATIVEGISMA